MLLSMLLGKDVVCRNTVAGTIDGVCWQKGKSCSLQCGESFLGADKVKVKDNVVCDNLQSLPPLPKLKIEKSVYDTDGKLLGTVQDVELTTTLKVKSLLLDNGVIVATSKIIANNDIITVKSAKPKKAKKKIVFNGQNQAQDDCRDGSFVTPVGKVEQVGSVLQVDENCYKTDSPKTVVGVSIANTQKRAVVGSTNTPLASFYPKRKSGDFSFLIGKRVDKNIVSFWGELMIREGEIVTREVYLKARIFGKLTELCLHTK